MSDQDLAQRIRPQAAWSDLPFPADQVRALKEIGVAARAGARKARPELDGGGASALFVGAPGAGKSLAAEALARDLGADLLRVDLGRVVGKFIGETEKNLRQIFDAAAKSGAVLFFDEADALFGKRTEVRDSHDRYANADSSHLLRRMETYPGLSILAVRRRDPVDPAFVRSMRYVVDFQPPGQERTPLAREAGEE